MNKKAQFYILAAVILLTIAFIVFAVSNKTIFKKTDNTFDELHANYVREASSVVNSAIFEKNKLELQNPDFSKVESFTNDFITYARTRMPAFSLMYMLTYKNSTIVANKFEQHAIFSSGGLNYSVSPGQTINVTSSGSYDVYAFGNKYSFDNIQQTDFNVIFHSEQDKEVRVFVQQ